MEKSLIEVINEFEERVCGKIDELVENLKKLSEGLERKNDDLKRIKEVKNEKTGY